jgi:hypothetical protein
MDEKQGFGKTYMPFTDPPDRLDVSEPIGA